MFAAYIFVYPTIGFAVVHSSPSEITLTSLRKAYPLYCLMSHHCDTRYQWQLLEQSDVELPSSPVVHIKQSGIYKCTCSSMGITGESNDVLSLF